MTTAQRWQIASAAPIDCVSHFPHLPRQVAQILFNRGLTDPTKVEQFIACKSDDDNPFSLKDMHKAVTGLREAIRSASPIVVYGDFDADGVTSTALLVETLRALGAEASPYIPHRVDEGYGLNIEALDTLADRGVRMVVTVDCGTRALDPITHAAERGLDVIVADHHSAGETPPPALAIINPKQADCPYPFKELAGVGVAFKLAQALLRSHGQVPITEQAVHLDEEDLLDLVALGTVADLVPLVGENRALVRRGLAKINEGQRPGLISLVRQSGAKPGHVDSATISFGLGPRINAAGRLDHAKTAYQLLMAQYPGEADLLAGELNNLNRRRQRVTAETQELAHEQALTEGSDAPLLFAASPDFLAGISGLAAGRLCEKYYRPAIVVHVGETFSRGSARSIAEFHITEALDQCKDLLVRHGGHAAAAGFTVRNEDLPLLAQRLKDMAAQALADKELHPTLLIDAEIGLGELDRRLYDWLARMEPFGYANPRPVFLTRRLRALSARAVGADRSHLKLTLSDGRVRHSAIAFRQGYWLGRLPRYVDVAYKFELNRWNGREQLQLNVRDLRPSE